MKIKKESYKGINYCIRCGSKMQLEIDREDKLRPICTQCGWIFYKNPIPAAACVILNDKNEVVIIQRLVEPNIGEWALPSGYIEINQSPEEAAVQEMLEETGLQGKVIEFLGIYDGHSPIYEKVLSVGFLMKIIGGKLEPGDDAGDAKYVSIDNLPPIAFASHRYYLDLVRKKIITK